MANSKENFKQRIEEQKKFLADQIIARENEAINAQNNRIRDEKQMEKQEQDERNKKSKKTKEIFKNTGIVELCEQICIDGTLPPSSKRKKTTVPITNFLGKIIRYEVQSLPSPCSVECNENTITIDIVNYRDADSSIYEFLTISKKENLYTLSYCNYPLSFGYREPFLSENSFKIATTNSDEILDGIARVAAIYQLKK